MKKSTGYKFDQQMLKSIREIGAEFTVFDMAKMVSKTSYQKVKDKGTEGMMLTLLRFKLEFGFNVPSSVRVFADRPTLIRQIWDRIERKVDVSDWKKIYDEQDGRPGVICN